MTKYNTKKIIRIINKTKNFYEHTDNIFSTNTILKFNSLITLNTLIYIYNLHNNNLILKYKLPLIHGNYIFYFIYYVLLKFIIVY